MSQQEQHSIERGGDDLPSIRGTLFPYPDVAHNFSQNQVAIEAGGGTVLSVLNSSSNATQHTACATRSGASCSRCR